MVGWNHVVLLTFLYGHFYFRHNDTNPAAEQHTSSDRFARLSTVGDRDAILGVIKSSAKIVGTKTSDDKNIQTWDLTKSDGIAPFTLLAMLHDKNKQFTAARIADAISHRRCK